MEYKKSKKKFSLQDQYKIATTLQERKRKFEEDKNNPSINKAVWNAKRKKWVYPFTQKGYIQPTVREIFTDLKEEKCDTVDFKSATKFVSRCLQKLDNGDFDAEENRRSDKYRLLGAGKPRHAVEVRQALFSFFIDVRTSLKGRLPRSILISKAKQIYEEYCDIKRQGGEEPDQLQFTNRWLNEWCKEYRISLKHPNKRFSISNVDRKRRIIQFLKNVWATRYWWLAKYKCEPAIISADQMPLHRNESSGQKTLNFKGNNQTCFVKENSHFSRERATVMTIVSSTNKIETPPIEFVFKGAGKRVKVNPPAKTSVQWAEKGSYRLEHILKFIENLPTIPIAFAPEKRCVFTLDDYSAHLPQEVEDAFHKKGYFLIVIGGGITGDVQVNDTSYHRPVKTAYRNLEMQLMLDLLKQDPKKIPSPSRDQMMEMFYNAWEKTCSDVNCEQTYKSNMMTLAFDGSEDHLASKKLMDLVGEEMLVFREQLLKSTAPDTLKQLRSKITKPEGVGNNPKIGDVPLDEGYELFDGDDGILEETEGVNSDDDLTDSEDTEAVDMSVSDEIPAVALNNDELTKETTTTELPNTPSCNLDILNEIDHIVKKGKESGTQQLIPHLIQIENITSNARRKLIKDSTQVDGFVQDALERSCFDVYK